MKKIKEKAVNFQNQKEEKLWGVLSLPGGSGQVPGVLLVHGFSGTKSSRKFVKLGRELARNGIASLRFDFSGCGDSEGELENLSISQQVEELKSAYGFLTKQARIDPKRIGLFGHSLGALVVGLFQTKHPVAKSLVLAAPAINQEALLRIWHTPLEIQRWKKMSYLDTPKGRIGVQYLAESRDYTGDLSKIKAPVLIIHGEKDDDVPIRFSTELLKDLNGKKEMCVIDEADHDFESYQTQKELIKHSLRWFERNL